MGPSDMDRDESDRGFAELTGVGALVRVTGPDPKGLKAEGRPFYSMEAGKTTLSASGFLCPCGAVEEGWAVVTSAMLLAPFMRLHEVTQEPLEELMPNCSLDILLESGQWMRCELAAIVRCRDAVLAADRLANTRPKSLRGVDVGCVALLRVPGVFAPPTPLPRLPHEPRREVRRGAGLSLVCSPFGLVSPAVFRNSLTTGIVSNVVRWPADAEEANLFLTDARCLPGSEGGAVFDASGTVLGMVAPSFQRMDQSSVELGAVIPWHAFAPGLRLDLLENACVDETSPRCEGGIFAQETASANAMSRVGTSDPMEGPARLALVRSVRQPLGVTGSRLTGVEDAVKRAAASVVLICVNTSWGSGIVVSDKGHIVSCAHLFRPYTQVNPTTKRSQMRHAKTRIRVTFRDHDRRVECPAQLLFCSRGPVDVALLQLIGPKRELQPTAVPLLPDAARLPVPGDTCVAMGHAIFDPSSQLQSTVSAGVISRVVPSPSNPLEPAILQTCASVFRGHSGGLLADNYGRFVGILTSNARHSNGNIIPDINFVIPINVLRPLLAAIYKDPSVQSMIFDSYDRPDPTLQSLWRLEATAAPPAPQVPSGVAGDDGDKGSRFADFLRQLQKQQSKL